MSEISMMPYVTVEQVNRFRDAALKEIDRLTEANQVLIGALKEAYAMHKDMCTVFKVPFPEASYGRFDKLIEKKGEDNGI